MTQLADSTFSRRPKGVTPAPGSPHIGCLSFEFQDCRCNRKSREISSPRTPCRPISSRLVNLYFGLLLSTKAETHYSTYGFQLPSLVSINTTVTWLGARAVKIHAVRIDECSAVPAVEVLHQVAGSVELFAERLGSHCQEYVTRARCGRIISTLSIETSLRCASGT